MIQFKSAFRRLGGFSSSILLTGVAGLCIIPIIVHYGGPSGWAAIVVGQSVGAVVGIFTALGWLQTGPTDVARSAPRDKGGYYLSSIIARAWTLIITLPTAAGVAWMLSSSEHLASAIAATATVLLSMGGAWFFIGDSRPLDLLLRDAGPRVMGMLAGALSLIMGAPIMSYVVCLLAGVLAAGTLSLLSILGHYPVAARETMTRKELLAIYRRQSAGLTIALSSSVYLSIPILYVSAVLPSSLATYALADRIKQYAMMAMTPVAQVFQSWVPRGGNNELRTRIGFAWRWAVILGSLSGLVFAALGPQVSHYLGAGRLSIDFGLSAPLGIAFGLNVLTLTTGTACLMALNRKKDVAISAILGMIVSVPLVIAGTQLIGVPGTAWAVACCQLVVAAYQSSVLYRQLRR